MRGATALVAIVALLSPGLVATAGSASTVPDAPTGDVVPGPSETWQQVLRRAARAHAETTYTGETLWVTRDDGQSEVALFDVRNVSGDGTVVASDRYTVTVSDEGGGLTHHDQGWTTPLPAANDDLDAAAHLAALKNKYTAAVAGTAQLLDRPCTLVEIFRRADDLLRERLWVDDATGLVLRRETYAGDEQPVRMAVYVGLDLDPEPVARTDTERADRSGIQVAEREHVTVSVDDRGLTALREAGWTVPDELPGGYDLRGAFALSATEGSPLQVVYGDGLYSVSLFQQPGRPDWESLPEGSERADEVDFTAYEWPGSVPQRLVWEAGGTTWSLVGDAPPDEFTAIAGALPRAEDPGVTRRVGRGLRRLWSLVSPWS